MIYNDAKICKMKIEENIFFKKKICLNTARKESKQPKIWCWEGLTAEEGQLKKMIFLKKIYLKPIIVGV